MFHSLGKVGISWLLFWTFLGSAGCRQSSSKGSDPQQPPAEGPSQPEGPSPSGPDVKPTETAAGFQLSGPAMALLGGVEKSCTQAGGTWKPSLDCSCPRTTDDLPQIFDGVKGRCESVALIAADCESAPDARMKVCLTNFARHGQMRMALAQPHDNYGDIRAFLQKHKNTAELRLPAEPNGRENGGVWRIWVGPFPSLDVDAQRLFENKLFPSSFENQPGFAGLYVPSIADLEAALGLAKPQSAAVTWNAADEPVTSLIKDLLLAWSHGTEARHVESFEIESPSGSCLEACSLTDSLRIDGFTDKHAEVRVLQKQRYQRGTRLPLEVTLTDVRSGGAFAKILFDFSNRVSLVIISEIKSSGSTVFNLTRVYDRSSQLLVRNEKVLVQDRALLRSRLAAQRGKPLTNEIPIAMFEPGILSTFDSAFQDSPLRPYLYLPADRGQDFDLGAWSNIDLRTSLQGIVDLTDDGLFPLYGSPNHTTAVGELLLGRGQGEAGVNVKPVRLVPLGQSITNSALVQAVTAARKATAGQLRVGSFQYRLIHDRDTCKKKLEPLLATGLLLVAAAGNEGRELSNNELCPGSIESHPQMLIVGAGDRQALAAYSNHGPMNIDILAPGQALSGEQGTSFAAPRVAYALAQMADAFPQASQAELRASLLLAADLGSKALPVRSGGVLPANLARPFTVLKALLEREAYRNRVGAQIPFDIALHLVRVLEDNESGYLSDVAVSRLYTQLNQGLLCFAATACAGDDARCQQLKTSSTQLKPCP